jgi:hypothetical protein
VEQRHYPAYGESCRRMTGVEQMASSKWLCSKWPASNANLAA